MKRKKTGSKRDCYRQRFSVSYTYPVHFTHGLLDPKNPLLADTLRSGRDMERCRVLVYVDDGLVRANPAVPGAIVSYLAGGNGSCELVQYPEVVPGGERAKNGWNVVQNIMSTLGNRHLCRHSFVIGVGGGSMLDMVGFAASIVHRGVRLIRVPTTVLSQGDGGVGVKNGMDEHGMKNFVGTFAPPFAVLNDFDFLETLESKYWIGGLSESFKVAIIKDTSFFDWLCRNASRLKKRQGKLIEEAVRRTAELHLDHIRTSGDPFEFGTARPLDFGHWAAHKLEVLSNYTLGHGQAVAIGIALDSCYACGCGLITPAERNRILSAMTRLGLPTWDAVLERTAKDGGLEVLKGLEDFREHLGGVLTVTLPKRLGRKIEVHEMDAAVIDASVAFLRDRKCNGP
jgi:3-dehydroquinate synthase